MTITFRPSTLPPATREIVDEFEATLPAPLPADYKEFLAARNGGNPEPNWWPPELDRGPAGVRLFHALGEVKRSYSLTAHRETFDGRIPEHLLSVGHDEGGGQICVELTGDDRGSVWFYNPGLEYDEGDEPDPELLTRVCDSFTDLLDRLEPTPEYDEMLPRSSAKSPSRGTILDEPEPATVEQALALAAKAASQPSLADSTSPAGISIQADGNSYITEPRR